MNCNTFIKKLNDFIEGSISNDLKKAMQEHMDNCEACRKIYDEEKSIDEMLREALKIDNVDFKSSRSEIMKSIDRNRYSKSPIKKFYYHLRKYKITYVFCTALATLLLVYTPLLMNRIHTTNISKNKNVDVALKKKNNYESKENEKIDKKEMKVEEPTVFLDKNYQFTKTKIEVEPSFNTSWKYSPNNKYSVCIEGKGENAVEEGMGTIILKDKDKNELWQFSLTNMKKQFTPKYVEWLDNENILIIIGRAYGTVTKGGNLYLLDLDAIKNYMVYDTKDTKKEIMKLEKINKDKNVTLKLFINVYEDENLIKSHEETVKIDNFKVIFDK